MQVLSILAPKSLHATLQKMFRQILGWETSSSGPPRVDSEMRHGFKRLLRTEGTGEAFQPAPDLSRKTKEKIRQCSII